MPIKEFLVSPAPEDVMFPDIQPEDALAHFCSSGSTGKPKTITYTHFMILN
ncbi:hypothetical protein DPMN_111038 [Dreissena polymorpha]|uniref:Uncharacterized protein n=1 Tax=Dreissena polymorpha TaxID=45954 RepID=A0A9D4KD55_DREPO|nr:hypothetical protein DPMN_111038 [Dreissena polymorpha]